MSISVFVSGMSRPLRLDDYSVIKIYGCLEIGRAVNRSMTTHFPNLIKQYDTYKTDLIYYGASKLSPF